MSFRSLYTAAACISAFTIPAAAQNSSPTPEKISELDSLIWELPGETRNLLPDQPDVPCKKWVFLPRPNNHLNYGSFMSCRTPEGKSITFVMYVRFPTENGEGFLLGADRAPYDGRIDSCILGITANPERTMTADLAECEFFYDMLLGEPPKPL